MAGGGAVALGADGVATIPLVRGGESYHSLTTVELPDLRRQGHKTSSPVARVSQANPGLLARDLARSAAARGALEALSVAELIAICKRAGEFFLHDDLPLGGGLQSVDDYLRQLSATTGMPQAMARANMGKVHYVLDQMATVLGGLTRGLDLSLLDRGYGEQGGRAISYRRQSDLLGAVLPSNSPGVHSLWLPAIALKVGLAIKPGRQEPWTPYRLAQALLAAGCPRAAIGFYPTSHAGAAEILQRCGRSLLFGDAKTVGSWAGDERVQLHGPGWSKVVLDEEAAAEWPVYLDLLAASVADNGGRSCINASGVWTARNSRALATGLAERLAEIEARALDDPQAALAAMASREVAQALSDYIDARLGGGAVDLSAEARVARGGGANRVAEVDGCAFLLPTVIHCESPDHPLAQAEFLFPFVSVVEVAGSELARRMGSSLVVTALTRDPELRADLIASPFVERLNLGPIPTSHVTWDQPHEGNLFSHLYRQRALQDVPFGAVA